MLSGSGYRLSGTCRLVSSIPEGANVDEKTPTETTEKITVSLTDDRSKQLHGLELQCAYHEGYLDGILAFVTGVLIAALCMVIMQRYFGE